MNNILKPPGYSFPNSPIRGNRWTRPCYSDQPRHSVKYSRLEVDKVSRLSRQKQEVRYYLRRKYFHRHLPQQTNFGYLPCNQI